MSGLNLSFFVKKDDAKNKALDRHIDPTDWCSIGNVQSMEKNVAKVKTTEERSIEVAVPSDGENLVRHCLVEFLVPNSIYLIKRAPSYAINRVQPRVRNTGMGTDFVPVHTFQNSPVPLLNF